MPAPNTIDIRKPLLEAFKDEAPHGFVLNDYLEIIAAAFGENVSEMSSIDKNLFKHKINEAKTYLRNHGLLSHPSKSTYMITRRGLKALEDNPAVIDDEYFAAKVKEKSLAEQIIEADSPADDVSEPVEAEVAPVEVEPEPEPIPEPEPEPVMEIEPEPEPISIPEPEPEPEPVIEPIPEPVIESVVEPEANEHEDIKLEEDEIYPDEEEDEEEDIKLVYPNSENEDDSEISQQKLDEVFEKYNSDLSYELLNKVAELPSDKFEILVIDLLSKMGYFAFQTARYAVDSPGNELIHGVILDNNKPGTHPIYIQARKLNPEKTVGRSDMNDFVKALSEKGGAGIFATTANFSEQAKIVANDERIMLIDGSRLAGLMIANNFCVNVEKIFEVKSIDLDSLNEYED